MGYVAARAGQSTIDRELCTSCQSVLASQQLGWCRKGRHAAPLIDFPKRSRACQGCILIEARAWRAAHSNHVQAYRQRYVESHHDELIRRSRTYYQLKREQILAQKRVYYQVNRARLIAKVRLRELRLSDEQRARLRARRKELGYSTHQYRRHLQMRRFLASIRLAS